MKQQGMVLRSGYRWLLGFLVSLESNRASGFATSLQFLLDNIATSWPGA